MKYHRLIAAFLLLTAILPMPYGYYKFLRIAITIISGYSAVEEHENKNSFMFWFFLLTAIMYNPLIPIYLTREIWLPINIIGIIGFVVLEFKKKKN